MSMIAAAIWSLIASTAAAAPPCEDVELISSTCTDGQARVMFSFTLPDLPDERPVRTLEMKLFRVQGSPADAYQGSTIYGSRPFYGLREAEVPTQQKKTSVVGPCGGSIDFVELAYQAWIIDAVTMDVQGRLSKAATWLQGEAEAAKRGLYVELTEDDGSQMVRVKWAGSDARVVSPSVLQEPLDGATPAAPMKGSFGYSGNAPSFEWKFFPKAKAELSDDPLLRMQIFSLKEVYGTCRIEGLVIPS